MDLVLANIITIVFFISGYTIIQKAISNKPFSSLTILGYFCLIFCGLSISAMFFAFLVGLALPEIYPITLSYKAIFVCPFISLYFLYKMLQSKRMFNVRT
ncbi:hypothetical protein KUL49_28750 [Alteromonas sp. KUL49]|nr:hypothetical protein KUL49_28750 [Alteromonas sp. KUL49]